MSKFFTSTSDLVGEEEGTSLGHCPPGLNLLEGAREPEPGEQPMLRQGAGPDELGGCGPEP